MDTYRKLHLQKGKEWNEDRIIKSSGPRVGNVP